MLEYRTPRLRILGQLQGTRWICELIPSTSSVQLVRFPFDGRQTQFSRPSATIVRLWELLIFKAARAVPH